MDNMTFRILYQDPVTLNYFDLENFLIDFGKLELQASEKVHIIIVNNDVNRNLKNVELNTVAHPTRQTGTAMDTYEACLMSTEEAGTFTRPLNIGTIGPGAQKDVWLRWTIAQQALPGYGVFAIYGTGEYDL